MEILYIKEWKRKQLVDTDTGWAFIAQESLIGGLITVQWELRMKRFGLTWGRSVDYHWSTFLMLSKIDCSECQSICCEQNQEVPWYPRGMGPFPHSVAIMPHKQLHHSLLGILMWCGMKRDRNNLLNLPSSKEPQFTVIDEEESGEACRVSSPAGHGLSHFLSCIITNPLLNILAVSIWLWIRNDQQKGKHTAKKKTKKHPS